MNNPMQAIMQMILSGGNVNQVLQTMAKQNPQAQAILNQMQQSGMTPKQYVMQYAKQNNIDINQYINMINKMGGKL